jgi:LemA protein
MSDTQFLTTFLFIVVFIVGYAIATYNYLVRLRNHIRDAWSNIDTELKRRYDLIPNLVASIKGYTAHEQELLERVVTLRKACMADQGSVEHQESTEKLLVGAVQQLMAVVEGYPDLKADNNFMQLQVELVNTEDRIQAARRFYNGNVRDYENRRESFPGNIVANMFNFEPRPFFNVDPAVRVAPSITGIL